MLAYLFSEETKYKARCIAPIFFFLFVPTLSLFTLLHPFVPSSSFIDVFLPLFLLFFFFFILFPRRIISCIIDPSLFDVVASTSSTSSFFEL